MTGYPVTITVNGNTIDPCHVGLPLTLTHGRSTIDAQPDAPTLSWTHLVPVALVGDEVVLRETTQWNPATYDSATVDYDDGGAVYDDDGTGVATQVRFVGNVASVTATESEGEIVGWAVDCVGIQARLGYYPVTLTRPSETDVARVQALAASLGFPVRIHGTSTLMLAAATISDTDYLAALHDICASSGGLFWQSPDGTLNYGTANHRQVEEDPLGVLPCEAIADGLTWTSALEQIINSVKVSWAGGDTTQQDLESIAAEWGVRHQDVQTILAAQGDAEVLAAMILARRAWPYWGVPDALVYEDKATEEDIRLMAALDTSTPVMAPFQPIPGHTPYGVAPATVEGFVETWTDLHTWQVALSDTTRWVDTRARTYQEVYDQKANYNEVFASGTYLDLLTQRG